MRTREPDYQTATVLTSRRRAEFEIGKRESEGWQLAGREDRWLLAQLMFRRQKSRRRRPVLIAALVAVLASGVLALNVTDWSLIETSTTGSDRAASRTAPDEDGDGVPDEIETVGWSNEAGGPYLTDPSRADTDGDGLSDGEEAGTDASSGEYLGRSDPTLVDTDDDGLSDTAEVRGWSDTRGDTFVTHPGESDTDADGLPDGLEAGELIDARTGGPVRASVANPREPDTDEDGIEDADEFFLDMAPSEQDSDDDGLADGVEVAFGSDPTVANGDGDHYSDKEEYARGSGPLAYDLTSDERLDAVEAGAKYGDCHACASGGGLRDEQVESVYYLGGQVGSGLAVYGDLRDLAYNVWHRRFVDALVAGVGVVPIYGDATKVSATLTKFAARSDRAGRAAYDFAQRLPTSIKDRLPSSLIRRGVMLPRELGDGARDNVVYLWNGTSGCPSYVGITTNLTIRAAQHARAGRCFIPQEIPGANALTRGEAQAIEEACILQGGIGAGGSLQNKIHSIAPTKDHHAEAVAWGTSFLDEAGVTCS